MPGQSFQSNMDWFQLIEAIGSLGQFLAAVFAAIAAWFAYRTVRVMREQVRLMQENVRASSAPFLRILWMTIPALEPEMNTYFPEDYAQLLFRNSEAESALKTLSYWWSHPSSMHPNRKYLVVKIQNLQTSPHGAAMSLQIRFKITVPERSLQLQKAFTLIMEHACSLPATEETIPVLKIEGVTSFRVSPESISYRDHAGREYTTAISNELALLATGELQQATWVSL